MPWGQPRSRCAFAEHTRGELAHAVDLLVDLGRRLEGDAGRRDDRDVFGDVGGEVAFVRAPHEQVRAADEREHLGGRRLQGDYAWRARAAHVHVARRRHPPRALPGPGLCRLLCVSVPRPAHISAWRHGPGPPAVMHAYGGGVVKHLGP